MMDDVPEEVKKRRLRELVETFYPIAAERNRRFIGTDQLVLVESVSVNHRYPRHDFNGLQSTFVHVHAHTQILAATFSRT